MSAADRYQAMGMVEGFGLTHQLCCVIHEGDPASKARARVMKGYSYTPAKTLEAQAALAADFAGLPKFTGNVAVACIFYRSNKQRIDVDNLLKLVFDASTQAEIWEDDSQVTGVSAILRYDPERPRTVVAFGHHDSTMTRGRDSWPVCLGCGKAFEAPARPQAKWCSRDCRMTLKEPVPCAHCSKPFKRINSHQKLCSDECRLAVLQEANRTLGPMPNCVDCGAPLSKHNYRRCRACFLADPRKALGIARAV